MRTYTPAPAPLRDADYRHRWLLLRAPRAAGGWVLVEAARTGRADR
jgi:hypothetical protein